MDVSALKDKQSEFYQAGLISDDENNKLTNIHQRISEISAKREMSPKEAKEITELLQASSSILLKDAPSSGTNFTQKLIKRSNKRLKQRMIILCISIVIGVSITVIKKL